MAKTGRARTLLRGCGYTRTPTGAKTANARGFESRNATASRSRTPVIFGRAHSAERARKHLAHVRRAHHLFFSAGHAHTPLVLPGPCAHRNSVGASRGLRRRCHTVHTARKVTVGDARSSAAQKRCKCPAGTGLRSWGTMPFRLCVGSLSCFSRVIPNPGAGRLGHMPPRGSAGGSREPCGSSTSEQRSHRPHMPMQAWRSVLGPSLEALPDACSG